MHEILFEYRETTPVRREIDPWYHYAVTREWESVHNK